MTARTPWTVLACAVALAACHGGDREASPPLPAGPEVVEVEMSELRFTYDPHISGGRVLFRIRNSGRLAHTMWIFPLSDDIPPIAEQLRGTERRSIAPFAGTRAVQAGAVTSLAVDLISDARYAVACFLRDEQDRVHARLGMNSEFRTAARSSVAAGPRR